MPSGEWVSSAGRPCWGADAGVGALAIRAAAAAEESGRAERGWQRAERYTRRWGGKGEGRDGNDGKAADKDGGERLIVIDVRPNQVGSACTPFLSANQFQEVENLGGVHCRIDGGKG